MINIKNFEKLKETQPLYWAMLSAIAAEELAWLNSSSKEEISDDRIKRFKRLHDGLVRHGIINTISCDSSFAEDLKILSKIS